MEAFQHLSARRQTGWSVSPIAYESIRAYLEINEVPRSDWAKYTRWICFIDNVYLELIAEGKEKKDARH